MLPASLVHASNAKVNIDPTFSYRPRIYLYMFEYIRVDASI